MEPSNLPSFDKTATYWLNGETLQTIMDYIKEKTVVLSGGTFTEVGPQGSKLDTISLVVCIGGVKQTKKFVIAI
jgi:hypothetical protein